MRRERLLHIGCGNNRLEGWMNVDIHPYPAVDVVMDVSKGLHFTRADVVYAEHFLEHLPVDRALEFLEEVHGVLTRNGIVRLSTPNLDWVWATHYGLEGDEDARISMAVQLNRAFHGWGHEFLWNKAALHRALVACGFSDIRWESYGTSRRDFLNNLESHEPCTDSPGLPHVLVVEASKSRMQQDKLRSFHEYLEEHLLKHMGV